MDTIEDSNAKDYKTLLTENHDAYKVKGRITNTPKDDTTLDNGEVRFKVEATNNFDGDAYGSSYKSPSVEKMLYSVDASNLMFTYSEALIQKDSDDNYIILNITPYGSNKTTVLETSLYEANSFSSDKISFYADANSTKTTDYKLLPYTKKDDKSDESGTKVYVNGVDQGFVGSASVDLTPKDDTDDKFTDKLLYNYVQNNLCGSVTLIDSTDPGKTTTDGKIDYILVDYYEDAVVDSITEGETYRVYFSQTTGGVKNLRIDTTDEDVTAKYVLDGKEIEYTELQKGDVLSIAYKPGDFTTSPFYEVIVSRNTVSGKVSATGNDSNDKAYYVINGENYQPVDESTKLDPGKEYVLYLNAFGKFVQFDEDSSNNLIGIFDQAIIDSSDTPKIRIITSAGAKVSYPVKDNSKTKYATLAAVGYIPDKEDLNEDKDFDDEGEIIYSPSLVSNTKYAADTYKKDIDERIVEYTVNSSGYITNITPCDDVQGTETAPIAAEYNASRNKISNISMSDITNVIDLSAKENKDSNGSFIAYDISKVSAATTSDFVDGNDYTILAADKSNSDATYRFVVVIEGGAVYSANSMIAVYNGEGSVYDETEGASVVSLDVFTNGVGENDDETTTLKVSSSYKLPTLKSGDAFIYTTDSDGLIDRVDIVFSGINENYQKYVNDVQTIKRSKSTATNDKYVWSGLASLPEEWANTTTSTKAGNVEVAFGVITNKVNNNVTLSQIDDGKIYMDYNKQTDDYTINSDAKIYVYDYSVNKNRLSVGTAGSVVKSAIPKSTLSEVTAEEATADLKAGTEYTSITETIKVDGENKTVNKELNFMYAKLVDGDIAEALVILGSN